MHKRELVSKTVLVGLTAIGFVGAAPAFAGASSADTVTAAATPIVSGYHRTVCVDDSDGSSANDTPVVLDSCTGSAQQDWTVEDDGTLQINGKCMDIYRDEKTNNAPVELWTCTGGANQQWQASNGTLVNPVSGKCLDDPRFNTADGTQLELYTCNGGANQQWVLPPVDTGPEGSAPAALPAVAGLREP
jgi:Ricin-type beta-trefoil lectin domain